jgi:hypothetical protein
MDQITNAGGRRPARLPENGVVSKARPFVRSPYRLAQIRGGASTYHPP